MVQAIQFYKYYWKMNEEDTGFAASEGLYGNIRFEIRDNTCKFNLNIQNLKPCASDYSYKCYLISSRTNKYQYTCLGNVEIQNQRAFLSCSLTADNVNNTGLDISDFNVAVVACEPEKITGGKGILFPLCGYKSEKVPWKNKLISLLSLNNANPAVGDKITRLSKFEQTPNAEQASRPEESSSMNTAQLPEENAAVPAQVEEKNWNNFMQNLSFFETNSLYNNSASMQSNFTNQNAFKTKNLENLLSMSFSECKPLKNANAQAKYWKVTNHQLLKRILHSCDFPEFLLVNSCLNTSYYIYGYFIIGIDSDGDSNFFLYGIPSIYGIDPRPLNLPSVWESENGSGELYGEFGYWIVRFNLATGLLT